MAATWWRSHGRWRISTVSRRAKCIWAASDVGWVVGHSYIVYAPLLHGATTVLFEGKPVGTPDAGTFWRIISEYGVAALFTAPTAFRAIKKEDPDGNFIRKYDLRSLRTLFLAGERADPDTVKWAEAQLRVPVVDHWWQTETGWPIAANPVGLGLLPVKYGSPTVAMPGYDVRVLDEGGREVKRGQLGAICVKLPLPPSCLPTLWGNDERFRASYLAHFPGYYETADAGYTDEDGYLYIMARTDDIINVAGHRLSTGGMEEVLAGHPNVAECAVIGIADQLKGQVPVGFVVLKAGVARHAAEIEKECVGLIRDQIGAVASFKTAMVVPRLPKTRSGKILRATMRKIADKRGVENARHHRRSRHTRRNRRSVEGEGDRGLVELTNLRNSRQPRYSAPLIRNTRFHDRTISPTRPLGGRHDLSAARCHLGFLGTAYSLGQGAS